MLARLHGMLYDIFSGEMRETEFSTALNPRSLTLQFASEELGSAFSPKTTAILTSKSNEVDNRYY